LVNTCAVRGKPVEKVVSLLGELRKQKLQGRELIVGMIGCLAQLDEGRAIADKFGVDVVLGPGAITDVLAAVQAIEEGRERFASFRFAAELDTLIPPAPDALTGFLTIMRGCDHHCTYCIVPTTRGPEVSRPVDVILREAEAMRDAGVQEVMLLGQNVNSYGLKNPALPSFADLLRLVAQVGIPRVKFTTSHPMNFTSDVIDVIAEEPNVCNFIHLPVQSGSDRVLRRMAREYRRDRYLEIVREIRAKVEDVVLSTDVIVGFPGETEEDFDLTLSLFDEVAYEHAYMFIYSARPGTPSYEHFEDMPRDVKVERLQRLIERQKHHAFAANRTWVGRPVRVLIRDIQAEGDYAMGHSDQNHTVLVPKTQVHRLGLHQVVVEQATPHTLYGSLLGNEPARVPLVMAS
jgi:tRNA-2-methylthio-N6-dimethylallyladenosine synthase